MRCLTIMNIEVDETKIYATKTKTNFALCFQLVKPEEYLMRHNYALVDKIEKKIKSKCKRIMELETKGDNWKRDEKARKTVQKNFRGTLISHRDRKSYNPIRDRAFDKLSNRISLRSEFDDRMVNSMYADPEEIFKFGGDKKQPLLEGGFEGNMKNLKIDDMNVSQILNYTAIRKSSYEGESIFSTMMKKDPTRDLKPDQEMSGSGFEEEATLYPTLFLIFLGRNLRGRRRESRARGIRKMS